jgi:hypothetical protein
VTPRPFSSEMDSPSGRNWVPLAIATILVAAVVAAGFLLTGRTRPAPMALNAPADPYASNLTVTDLKMLESTNLAGGKVTYLDGHMANQGDRTITAVRVLVIFRNYAGEVAQNETVPVTPVGIREPYVDTVPMSRAPLAPGRGRDFRLIFDHVSPDWAGALPELRVVQTVSN